MSEVGSSGSSSSAKNSAVSSTGKVSIQNGKGDAPRNISEKFRRNYDGINWGGKSKKK